MKTSLLKVAALSAWLAATGNSPALAQSGEPQELVAERIQSELPLYTFAWEDLWPRNFYAEDSFGCTSRVAFGDWRFVPTAGDESRSEHWQQFSNYGVIHCAAVMRSAHDRESLAGANADYGFFVRLGRARLRSTEWELWAMQKGFAAGSEYVLLARQAGQPGRVESFRMLQHRCPRGKLREADGLDVWRTRYCAINSRAELLTLARHMLRLDPVGTLEHSQEPSEPSTTTG